MHANVATRHGERIHRFVGDQKKLKVGWRFRGSLNDCVAQAADVGRNFQVGVDRAKSPIILHDQGPQSALILNRKLGPTRIAQAWQVIQAIRMRDRRQHGRQQQGTAQHTRNTFPKIKTHHGLFTVVVWV